MTLRCSALIRKPGILFIGWDVGFLRDMFDTIVIDEGVGEGGALPENSSDTDRNPVVELFSS